MVRLFDDLGEGYITVERFREILQEIDNTISKEELDGIISEVSLRRSKTSNQKMFNIQIIHRSTLTNQTQLTSMNL